MKAMILAAGCGTRLRPLTLERAKPAVPLIGTPLIGIILKRLASMGISECRLNLHALPETIIAAVEEFPGTLPEVSFSLEPTILGTGGGLKQNESFFSEDIFVMVNGDIIFDFDIREVIEFHVRQGAIATLALFPQFPPYSYTPIRIDDENVIRSFPRLGENLSEEPPAYVFTGLAILASDIFGFIRKDIFSDIVTEAYEPAIASGYKVCGYPVNGYWNDIGTPARYLSTQKEMFRRSKANPAKFISESSSIRNPELLGPYVSIGKACVIEEDCVISDSIVWENCVLRKGSTIKHCIIGANMVVEGNFQNLVMTNNGEVTID